MRVLEPKQLKAAQPKRKRGISKIVPLTVVFALLTGLGVYLYASHIVVPVPASNNPDSFEAPAAEDPFSIVKKPLKQLTGDQFKDLYLSVAYPNTQQITDPPVYREDRY